MAVATMRRIEVPVRVVALDLDGTLLGPDKQIAPADLAAVRAAAAAARVVLVTARPPRSTRPFYEVLGLDTPSIHYNGALTWNPADRRPVEHVPVDGPLALEIARFARELHPEVIIHVESLDRWYTDRDDRSHTTETARHFEPDRVAPLEVCCGGVVTKLMLLADDLPLAAIDRAVNERFAGRITSVMTDRDLIQITAPGVGKAAALAALCDGLGVGSHEVLAVGDQLNDVGMIKWAGRGVAMGNAAEALKSTADWVASANDAGGVAAALRRYGLA